MFNVFDLTYLLLQKGDGGYFENVLQIALP